MLTFDIAGFSIADRAPQADWGGTRLRMARAVAAAAGLIVLLTLSGCNTFGGAGKDLEAAGDAIADTNDDTTD